MSRCWITTRLRAFATLLLAIALMAPFTGRSAATPLPRVDKSVAKRLPRSFVGTYQWRGGSASYEATLVIESVEVGENGILTIRGYDTTPTNRMKVEGTLNPKSRKLSLRESEPMNAGAVTDGSYEGEISEDLSTINAVWTTKSTGHQGDLKLKAR